MVAATGSAPPPIRLGRHDSGRLTPAIEQAVIETAFRQAARIPIPIAVVATVVSSLGFGRVPTAVLVIWVAAIAALQVTRTLTLRKLVSRPDLPTGRRLGLATVQSAINGVIVALCTTFFPYLDEISRSILSMLLIGMTTGGVAISHGYRPMFLAFSGPVLLALITAWAVVPSDVLTLTARLAVSILIVLLAFVLYSVAADTYSTFTSSFRINAELKRALRAEQSANNAKTRFLAAASHDLRQPLHTLSLLSAALTLRPLDDKSASIARSMNEAMSELAAELDALLDISKLDAGVVRAKPEDFEIQPLVSRLAANFFDQANSKGVRLEFWPGPGDLIIRSDRALVERILRNLIDNAVKYTEAGSVTIGVRAAGLACEVEIRDTGCGIAAEEFERVFEEFYQIGNVERDRRKGLGLGLSIVKRLAGLLGCHLALESRQGVGSCFRLTLPVATGDRMGAAPVTVQGLPLPPPALDGLHLLLIEDDLGARSACRVFLEELGCTISEASTTAEALAVAREVRPDLVLADIRLPEGDSGIEAVTRLRELDPGIRILLVSGETSPDRLREADRLGSALLVKPVSQAALLEAIERTMDSQPNPSPRIPES